MEYKRTVGTECVASAVELVLFLMQKKEREGYVI